MQIKYYVGIAAIVIILTCSVTIVVGWTFSKKQSETTITGSAETKINGGTIKVDVIRPGTKGIAAVSEGFYLCRIKVSTSGAFQQQKNTEYMQSGILRCFYAVSEGDTLHPVSIEIVPGINRYDFVYMACFKRKTFERIKSFEFLLADTVAGFGITSVVMHPDY